MSRDGVETGTVIPATLPRAAVLQAAREMNRGRYFEAHEALEEHLDEVADSLWNLAVGLIQVAVGYHKIGQGLLQGAATMFDKALPKLEAYAAGAGGIDVEALRRRVREDSQALCAGKLDLERFRADPPRLRPIRLVR